jgi:hypothetical protein
MARLVHPLFEFLPEGQSWIATHTLATILAFTLITFMHVVLGELAPKAVALERPDAVSLWVARPLLLFSRVMRPFIAVMNTLGNGVVRLLGFKPISGHEMVHSVEELGLIIEETRRAGLISREHAEFVRNVFRMPAKRVRDCMVPRDQMASLELHMPEERILAEVREGAHTRMPVYDATLDNVVGIVNTKDLFHLFSLRGRWVWCATPTARCWGSSRWKISSRRSWARSRTSTIRCLVRAQEARFSPWQSLRTAYSGRACDVGKPMASFPHATFTTRQFKSRNSQANSELRRSHQSGVQNLCGLA